MLVSLLTLAALAGAAFGSPLRRNNLTDTPSVNLGYEIHTATTNSSGGYYIFSNIPYAEQPTGDLRFHTVGLPQGNSSGVNNGLEDMICMQSYPKWIIELTAQSNGVSTEVMEQIMLSQAGQTEACLALDVHVPTDVFEKNTTEQAPVLVWIHGGGFTSGSKTSVGSPAGIIARSKLNDNEGVIVVSINYRLGLFGWLGAGGITPNLGLYDQRVALEWVQKYIGRFGGDAARVTTIGESAGATSILHHITAYGGEGSLPFAQGIIQSPAFQFNLNLTDAYEATLTEATNATGKAITNASELASLDSETLKAINFGAVKAAPQGQFTYGPAPDRTYVPALPQVLLAQGNFHSNVNVMAAHNSFEAAPFVPSTIASEEDLIQALTASFPEIANMTHVLDTLYPASDYQNDFLRGVQLVSDVDFSCTTRYLALALGNQTYNYIFAVPPGYHAQDTSYTFFNGDTSTLNDGVAVDANLAAALQDYIVGFAATGVPDDNPAGTAPEFPVYGEDAAVARITAEGVVAGTDDTANERCAWWQQAMVEGIV
ncbi:hypothetical protein INS49_008764 [Diaporthe citri]|uniref:uncharacterized protein n=1 Tax=Diaporthe citri TaxID=83186 RepID=UPI001C7FF97C|nr:uncharacterized protein INS49_008764 [Diaporthe citri]KAG6363663.1 hypothetical protein INS49_008764 [Diaporthe citri]